MVKTGIAIAASLVATGLLWGWTSGQFTNYQAGVNHRFTVVQHHQNDALRSILCYLERRTLKSPRIPVAQKVESLHTLDQIDRVGHLAPCRHLPTIRHS